MIHSLLSQLQTKIKAQFSALKKVDYYKGEFEEGTDWNPIFPVVFTNCAQIVPRLPGSSKVLVGEMMVSIYIGIRIENADQTALFENLILYLNSLNQDEDLKKNYTFEMKPVLLLGYFYGNEAYKIDIAVTKKFV